MEQVQAHKQVAKRAVDEVPAPEVAVDQRNAKLTEDIDDILDEIDLVLEPNAQEFVQSYVQKGGE